MASNSVSLDELDDVGVLLSLFEQNHETPAFDPVPILTRLAELLEIHIENYLKADPDPIEDNIPYCNPMCFFGTMLKTIVDNSVFMEKLVGDYMWATDSSRICNTLTDSIELNTLAARILLDIKQGHGVTPVAGRSEELIPRLFLLAMEGPEPLQTYSVGLLAGSVNSDLHVRYRRETMDLRSLVFNRLWENFRENTQTTEPLPSFQPEPADTPRKSKIFSWVELQPLLIGTFQIHPMTDATRQILILRYLTDVAKHDDDDREFRTRGDTFLIRARDLVLMYIDTGKTPNSRLSFEALMFLGALFGRSSFLSEFIRHQGVQRLLTIPRPSIAATAVAWCMHICSRTDATLQSVCLLEDNVLERLVGYGLWLLECSHHSGRRYSASFFGASFKLPVILELFDAQDGLRYLLNMISTASFLLEQDTEFQEYEAALSERYATPNRHLIEKKEREESERVDYACEALSEYFKCHLALEVNFFRFGDRVLDTSNRLIVKGQEFLPFRNDWAPLKKFVRLGGVKLLLRIVALAPSLQDWNSIDVALDVLVVCSLLPEVHRLLCAKIQISHNEKSVGMRIILETANENTFTALRPRMAALQILINCICYPDERTRDLGAEFEGLTMRTSEGILEEAWTCVQSHAGLSTLESILLQRIDFWPAEDYQLKALVCKVLLGFIRSQHVWKLLKDRQLPERLFVMVKNRQEIDDFQHFAYWLFLSICGSDIIDNGFDLRLNVTQQSDVLFRLFQQRAVERRLPDEGLDYMQRRWPQNVRDDRAQ